ncbi:MAG: hypothetical protein LBS44_00260, partial [Deltaproteobacteria bacterium]|nr:hypothetical protein [Deltaproteobacteria bacterium]
MLNATFKIKKYFDHCPGRSGLIGQAGPRWSLCLSKALKFIFMVLVIVFSFLAFQAFQPESAYSVNPPLKDKYMSPPVQEGEQAPPRVLLVMSKELKMFQHGYPGLTDIDGDGSVDTGFNPKVEYVGFFDSRSCYAYSGSKQTGTNTVFVVGDINGYFFRVGSTIEDQSQEDIDKARPSGIKSYVGSPRSLTGVCSDLTQSVSQAGQRTFSGNWLNYLTTSRMDGIAEVLYGGRRVIDTTTRTVLESSFVPPDATAWGSEVRSNDTWMEVTPNSVWYDLRKYTPFDLPKPGTSHFFARSSDLGTTNQYFPAMKVLFNVKASYFNVGGLDSVNAPVIHTKPYPRYWDWVLVNRPLPDDRVLVPSARQSIEVYNLKIEVCNKDNMGETEGCQRYPGLTSDPSDDIFKPVGLLQRYGGGGRPINFGLLTGSYNSLIRLAGGKLRNHIGPVYGATSSQANSYVPPVNPITGQINPQGLIKNIDNLRISGRPVNKNPADWDGERYYNTFSWGNPLAEMLYEGIRYLAGSTDPSATYNTQDDTDEPGSTIRELTSFPRVAKSWNTRKLESANSRCSKPIVLLISDTNAEFDGDQFYSDISLPLLSEITLPSFLTERTNLPPKFDKKAYLDTITGLENITNKDKYIYSSGNRDSCLPKTLKSLNDIKGLCPFSPSTEGTYSVVAVAYYARIHDFNSNQSSTSNKSSNSNNLDVYSVTMSASFPELVFNLEVPNSQLRRSVSILPASITAHPSSNGMILGILNYFVLDWETDRDGDPFHVKVKVNFSDQAMGDDWEGDAQVTYDINLLTDSSTSSYMRESVPVRFDSGEKHLKTLSLYKFKNPSTAETRSDFIDFNIDHVKAIMISSSYEEPGTGVGMAMGYTISGTKQDGTYMDLTMNTPPASLTLTPKDCEYLGGSTLGVQGCTKIVSNLKRQARVFALSKYQDEAKTLPNPMWLAAKYGSFNDLNSNGVPDPGEWEGPDGSPKNYFQTTNIAELPAKLEEAFRNMAASVSSGFGTSASVNSILSSGLSVQSYYYPLYADKSNNSQLVKWVGGVYGLFIDRFGNLREDSDGDAQMTMKYDPAKKTGDKVVTITSAKGVLNPPVCYVPGKQISLCQDLTGANTLEVMTGAKAHPENIHRVATVFDTAKWLAYLDDTKLISGSRPYHTPATINDGRRLIYYGQPVASGGVELARFNVSESLDSLLPLMISNNFAEIIPGVAQSTLRESTKMLIEYITGKDQHYLRSRQVKDPWGNKGQVTWRHGDVINSKPVLVAAPGYGYDFLYNDKSYIEVKEQMATRRQMLYSGANDGMLHAINLGFNNFLSSGQVDYQKSGQNHESAHDIGAEMWAYIPTSALPHLQWLGDPDYIHTDYVDMKPMVTDVKIDGKWKTVLIGGMRLGGRPIEASSDKGPQGTHYFSEFFALDITNPEVEPKLLWRYSSLKLGLSVGMPAVVRSNGNFYVVLASGPVTDQPIMTNSVPGIKYGLTNPQDGISNQKARLIVLDMKTGQEVV